MCIYIIVIVRPNMRLLTCGIIDIDPLKYEGVSRGEGYSILVVRHTVDIFTQKPFGLNKVQISVK